MEVHSLLEKIPAELIALDASQIGQIHEPSLQQNLEEKSRILYARMPKVEFTPKYKALGGATGWLKRKKTVAEEVKRQQIKEVIKKRQKLVAAALDEETEVGVEATDEPRWKPRPSVFDRFKRKKTL